MTKCSTRRSKTLFSAATRVAAFAVLLPGTCLPNYGAALSQTLSAKQAVSPRIAALDRELQSGKLAALDQFWQAVTSEGTPIIEAIQGDERNTLVTFVWRAKEQTNNVVVFGCGGGDLSRNQMSRLPNTDLCSGYGLG